MTVATQFEAACQSRHPGRPEANEDRVLVLPPDFAAVIDGATDLSGDRYDGLTGGALAAAAIAAAFARAWLGGEADHLLDAGHALEVANEAIRGVYARYGLEERSRAPEDRFRAAFSIVARRGGIWHLSSVGDCAVRVDGQPVLGRDHPAESVVAGLRARLVGPGGPFAADPEGEAAIWPLLTLGRVGAPPEGAQAPAVDTAIAAVEAGAIARGLAPGLVRAVLDHGLTGMRRALGPSDPLHFGVADGYNDALGFSGSLTWPAAEVRTIELHSDGYLRPPAGTRLADWEAEALRLLAADPRLVGTTPVVKAPPEGGFHDDRSVVVVRCG